MAKIGSCFVVAGGFGKEQERSVEVMDPNRGVVWRLANMTAARSYGSMAVLSKNIVVLSGYRQNSFELLGLVSKQEQLKVRVTRTQ